MGVMKHIASDPVLRRKYAEVSGDYYDDDVTTCELCGRVTQGNIKCFCNNLEVQENVDESSRT